MYLFIIITAAFFYFLFRLKFTNTIIYMKKLVIPAACVLFILFLLLFSKSSLESARDGLELWLNTLVPSLFPFLAVSAVLRTTGFIRRTGRFLEKIMRPVFDVPGSASFAYIMGILSGYPVGAKITSGMMQDGMLSQNEAERLLAFSNNSGPVFITGAVSAGMFGMEQAGILLLLCHIASGFITGMLIRIRFLRKKKQNNARSRKINKVPCDRVSYCTNQSLNLSEAISDSVNTLLLIGGFVIGSSVIISILKETNIIDRLAEAASFFTTPSGINKPLCASLISGIVEITNGCSMLGQMRSIPLDIRLAAAALLLGWGGISVHMQVYGIASKSGLRIGKYVMGKFIHGITAALLTYAAANIFLCGNSNCLQAFSQPAGMISVKPVHTFLLSVKNVAAALLVILPFVSGKKPTLF